MKILLPLLLWATTCALSLTGKTQSQEAQQLLLNVEKLAQLKAILTKMKQGYTVISGGYERIKNLSKGNFDLHKLFLDKLLEVSPIVRNYYKVAAIFRIQRSILSQCAALRQLSQNGALFSAAEQRYLTGVQENLLGASLRQVETLTMLLTSGQLRMDDAERLAGIDRVYHAIQDQSGFIQNFTTRSKLLGAGRKGERIDVQSARRLHQITP